MTYYSQKSILWRWKQLGTCNTTIGKAGCFISSLGMLTDRNPVDVNGLLTNFGGYSGGCLVNSVKAASLLGLEYLGRGDKPDFTCIAETNFYKSSGYPQHFFVLFPDGKINCPIKGERIANPYNIISYRLFKGEHMSKIWQPGEDIKFNPDQVSRLFTIIGRRTVNDTKPEGWDLIENLGKELDRIFIARDAEKANFIQGSIEKKKVISELQDLVDELTKDISECDSVRHEEMTTCQTKVIKLEKQIKSLQGTPQGLLEVLIKWWNNRKGKNEEGKS